MHATIDQQKSLKKLGIFSLFVCLALVLSLLIPFTALAALSADFSGDGQVNSADQAIINNASNWHKNPADKTNGDANVDGKVDINDFSIMVGQWGQGSANEGTQPANSINVKDYGARGDGLADDTAALNNAFSNAISQNKIAWLPSGTYLIANNDTAWGTCPVMLPNNIRIQGDKAESWIKGKVCLSTGNKLSYISLGTNGYATRLVNNVPVVNLEADHVTFKGGGGTDQAVFRIDSYQAINNSTFKDCVVETNADGVGNGISIVDNGVSNSTLHDVTFERLHIRPQPRMGFEMIGRSYLGTRTTDYYNISIVDSVVEAVGAESISFDGPGNHLLVKGTHFLGSNQSDLYSWHQALEFNGSSYASAIGNNFDRQRSWWLNMHCSNCTFDSNTFNSSVDTIGQTVGSGVQAWGGSVTNSTFSNNTVIMNTGAGLMYFYESVGNKFINNIFVEKRNTGQTTYLFTNSSGNTFTNNTFCGPAPGYNFSNSSDLASIKTSTFVSTCSQRN